jgi:hypothetical protein
MSDIIKELEAKMAALKLGYNEKEITLSKIVEEIEKKAKEEVQRKMQRLSRKVRGKNKIEDDIKKLTKEILIDLDLEKVENARKVSIVNLKGDSIGYFNTSHVKPQVRSDSWRNNLKSKI